MFLSLYSVTRHYGGPEEGGWWYDRHKFVRNIASGVGYEEACLRARRFNLAEKDRQKEDGRPQGRYSVLGGEDLVWYAEKFPREMDDTEEPVPHYC